MTDAIKLAIEALESSCDCIQKMTDGPGHAAWGPQLDANEKALAALRAQPDSHYNKTEMNAFVQSLYDQKMQEGKHGHYETMFHVVHKAIATAQPDHSELERDAARYRWLREQNWSSSKFAVVSNPKSAVNLGSICPSRELLDEAVDQSMAAIGETK